MGNWLLTIFESFPRLNFAFYMVSKTFMFVDDRDYVQSLLFWAGIPIILCLLLCVIVLIVWSLQCCRRQTDSDSGTERPAKRRNEVDRFACGFYAPIFLLCMVAGVCLYANEWANRGMNSFVASLDDMKHSANSFFDGISRVNGTISNATRQQTLLLDMIKERGATIKNETVLKLLLFELDEVTKVSANITHGLADMETKFSGFRNAFDAMPDWIARIELERWVLFVILYSTLFVIGVFGLIAVCKRSRKGSIGYGVGGIFVFVVGWALAASTLLISLMIADACTDVKPYIESKLSSEPAKEVFHFYAECVTEAKEMENPISVDTKSAVAASKAADKYCQEVSALIDAGSFPKSITDEMQRRLTQMRTYYGNVIEEISGLTQIADCRHIRREYESASAALCYNALPGFSLALLFTLVFCLILFGVLIAVSRAWRLFQKRMNDYMEVDSQDPFSIHRGTSHHSGSVLLSHDQSNIPADFYGTHVFNPRTRFASAAFVDEAEANGATPNAPTWRNTPPPAYDSMHRAQQMQHQRRQHQSTTTRTMA